MRRNDSLDLALLSNDQARDNEGGETLILVNSSLQSTARSSATVEGVHSMDANLSSREGHSGTCHSRHVLSGQEAFPVRIVGCTAPVDARGGTADTNSFQP